MKLSIMLLPDLTRSFQCSEHNYIMNMIEVYLVWQSNSLVTFTNTSAILLNFNETLQAYLELVFTQTCRVLHDCLNI